MEKAGKAEFRRAEGGDVRDIDVSVDGTYMTRGFSSKCGVVSAIGCVTGKVIDVDTRSKVCKSCDYWEARDKHSEEYKKWKEGHVRKCTANHVRSSGAMEADIAIDLFGRSVERHSLRYMRFIGDGDTNSFKKVFDSKPYVNDEIKKN